MSATNFTARRGERFRPGPLRVTVEPDITGALVDLSETGALLDLPTSGRINSHLEFDLYWEGIPARLQGRVVRSTPVYDSDRATSVAPTSFHVAVEFDLEARSTVRLYDFVMRARQGR